MKTSFAPPAARRLRACAAVALAFFLLVGIADRVGAVDDPTTTELLARINRERTQRKLPALVLNERLAAAAQSHAEDMAAMGRLSHEGSDGAGLDARLARAGYRFRFAAENIAAGQSGPANVVASWMKSAGHRRNILAREATEAGIGFVELSQSGARAPFRTYWVLVLARPP